jgi:hypothetical protein
LLRYSIPLLYQRFKKPLTFGEKPAKLLLKLELNCAAFSLLKLLITFLATFPIFFSAISPKPPTPFVANVGTIASAGL